MSKGILYIVATPIGNMADITLRALEVLRGVDLIISEDTRETDKILKRYEIIKSQLSYRDQNHSSMLPKITSTLESGQNIALISDSGTPLISDPGYKLVRELVKRDFVIQSIPGPSALISALVESGFPTDKFSFLGFLPKSKNDRAKLLKGYGDKEATLIIYESPFRVIKLLEEVKGILGERFVCLANEMTKIHEKIIRGKVSDLLNTYSNSKIKGEFVVLVAKEGFDL
jgi:16S rRNA (cytidine1402-2'-O)-methyltransferase